MICPRCYCQWLVGSECPHCLATGKITKPNVTNLKYVTETTFGTTTNPYHELLKVYGDPVTDLLASIGQNTATYEGEE